MNKILKYLSIAALMVPVVSCTEEKMEIMDPATLIESVSIEMDDVTTAKLYADPQTGTMTLPMVKGETIELDYTTVPEDLSEVTFPEMVWSSADKTIVSVSEDGVLTAVSAGTTVVTITSAAVNVDANASLTVKVVDTAVPAAGISVSSDATMNFEGLPSCYVGETMTLAAAITPEDATYKSVLWSSGDESIATVDRISGVVTGVSIGKVTITATALDAENPVTADFDIYIDQIINPVGIRINNMPSADDIFSLSQVSFTADFSTQPEACTMSLITWTSSDETIATVERGVVTFRTYGTVTITATCMDSEEALNPGFEKEVSFTLNIPAGYYNDDFSVASYPWWESDTNGAVCERMQNEHGEWYLNVTPGVQNASNWRGDIQRVPDALTYTVNATNPAPYENNLTFLNREAYPVICLRMDDKADSGAANRSIFIDLNNGYVDGSGSYARIWSGRIGGGGANKWAKKYKCSDGSALLIYDLSTQTIQTGGMLPETGVAAFPNFKIGYADIRTFASAKEAAYRLFWFKTFASEAELNAYLTEWSSETGITYAE